MPLIYSATAARRREVAAKSAWQPLGWGNALCISPFGLRTKNESQEMEKAER